MLLSCSLPNRRLRLVSNFQVLPCMRHTKGLNVAGYRGIYKGKKKIILYYIPSMVLFSTSVSQKSARPNQFHQLSTNHPVNIRLIPVLQKLQRSRRKADCRHLRTTLDIQCTDQLRRRRYCHPLYRDAMYMMRRQKETAHLQM
jgi:hypothetical protein